MLNLGPESHIDNTCWLFICGFEVGCAAFPPCVDCKHGRAVMHTEVRLLS